MSDPGARQRPLTIDEYRALEETSSERHEYLEGIVYAMTGATRRHNRIVGNIYRRLADAAGDGPCRIYVETVRVRAAERIFYYPDVVVACGEPGDAREEATPCVVVEVLSPSTESTDLREKALVYRRIPGLLAYLIVHQDSRWVHRHFLDDGVWYEASHWAEEDRIPVPCVDAVLTLADVYAGVDREGDGPPLIRGVREGAPPSA